MVTRPAMKSAVERELRVEVHCTTKTAQVWLARGVQSFTVGPCWDTLAEANWYAKMLKHALADYMKPPRRKGEKGRKANG